MHIDVVHKKLRAFTCTLCDKSFTQRGHLRVHTAMVHEKLKRFSCTFCDKSFSSNQYLTAHVNGVHKNLKPFTCTFCDKSFQLKYVFTQHLNAVHHKMKPFSCTLCDKSFAWKRDLTRHVAMHENNKNKRTMKTKSDQITSIKCTICGKSLGSNLDLNLHINEVHHKLFKCFSCTFCNRTFPQQEQLTEHQAAVHMKFSTCKLCNKRFSSEHYLNKHVIFKHAEHEKPNPIVHQESKTLDQCTVACKVCKIKFVSHEGLEKHEMFCEQLRKQEEATNKTRGKNFSKNDPKGNRKPHETFKTVYIKNCTTRNGYVKKIKCQRCKKYYGIDTFKRHMKWCRDDGKKATLEFVDINTSIGHTFSKSDLKTKGKSCETFNTALRCPKCMRYYRKDKLKKHIILCEHDAKTQSISDSIPNHKVTGTSGTSHPIVITPVTWDKNTQDGHTLESKNETQTDQSEFSRPSYNTGANYHPKSETTDFKSEEPFKDKTKKELKDIYDRFSLLQTNVLDIKLESDFPESYGTGNIVVIQPKDNNDCFVPPVDVCEANIKTETDIPK